MNKKKFKKFIICMIVVFAILFLSIITSPYKYDEICTSSHLGFSLSHPFGTDYLGRDFFVRVCYGIINTLLISVFSIFCSLIIGVLYGTYSGYKGKKVDGIMFFIVYVLECIPDFLIAILLLIVFNNLFISSGLIGIFITLVITSWTQMARIINNETKKIMQTDYVQYSITKKAKYKHILFFHLLPNLKDIMIVTTIQKIPSAIFIESFLSFVGIGIQPPYPSLGKMISEGLKSFRLYPFELLIPCVSLIIVVMIFNLFGESLLVNKDGDSNE
jgi:oligopeptide transport system permease protein